MARNRKPAIGKLIEKVDRKRRTAGIPGELSNSVCMMTQIMIYSVCTEEAFCLSAW
jgi:hypothetical protein